MHIEPQLRALSARHIFNLTQPIFTSVPSPIFRDANVLNQPHQSIKGRVRNQPHVIKGLLEDKGHAKNQVDQIILALYLTAVVKVF